LIDPTDHTYRPYKFIYDMIETLLPRANYEVGKPLRMMEM